MKLRCKDCGNMESEKFSKTKSGAICLCCYERRIEIITDNQAEKAEFEIYQFLTRATGSNNRKWTNAYRGMSNKLQFLKNLPNPTEEQKHFTNGFEAAIKTFNENV